MRITPLLSLPLWIAAASYAQVYTEAAPLFTHEELTCLTPEHFPVVEATVDPAELAALRKAQVYFKAGQNDDWYYVEMEPGEGSRLRAILPKPLGETVRVDYYLFFLTGSFGTSQSAERSVRVNEDGCANSRDVLGGSTVSLTLKATVPNQLPIPPGFQPQGIAGLVTTAGNTVGAGAAAAGGAGGVSGATVGVIAGAGAAAAGTAVAVSSADSGDVSDNGDGAPSAGEEPTGGATSSGSTTGPVETPSPPPTNPTPAPPPEPTVPDVSGTWLMSNQITETCYPEDLGRRSDRLMAIQQNGNSLTASFVQTANVGNFTGTIDSMGNLTLNGRVVDTEGATSDVRLEATTSSSGSSMSGNMTVVYLHNGCVVRATFSGTKR